MKKPMLISLLFFALSFFSVEQSRAADVSDLKWTTTGGEVTIDECNELASGELVIPSTIDGKPVTRIGEEAFLLCTNLTAITIPDSVTSIGDWAFDECTSLTSIEAGQGNINYTDINGVLFNKLKTTLVAYPAGKTGTNYTIPKGVIRIDQLAFGYCRGLTSITIPDSVTSIGEEAFWGCTDLTSITFLGNAPSLAASVFRGVSDEAKIYIQSNATGFGNNFGGLPVKTLGNDPDTDKDGWKDKTEVLFGSSPDNAKSVPAFKLKMDVLEGDQLELLFPGEKGARYSVQTSDDMKNWLLLEKLIIGQGKTVSERFSISAGLGFFRVKRE